MFPAPTIGTILHAGPSTSRMNGSTPTLRSRLPVPNDPANELICLRHSANPTLVPTYGADIFTKDASGNCTVTVTPATGKQGVGTVTITVS